ncbi:TonB-dependent receptor domain-containing protein [Parabacteroides sp. APC149_11_2_Y6]
MMERKTVHVFILLLFVFNLWGQISSSLEITGKIVEQTTEPLQNVTLLVLNPGDSSYVAGTVSDSDGSFCIGKIPVQNYLLEISMLGFGKKYIEIKPGQKLKVDLGILILEQDAYSLKGVVVIAQQKQIEVDAGKMVVNLSASVLGSQGNILDALKNLPGVVVREDGSVYLNGQADAQVLINDKLTYLTDENLINLLRSIPSSSVDNVELVSHPSSKYDAAGNSGIINIQMKKVKLQGMTFTATSNLEYGENLRGNENLFLTVQKNKLNFYVNYSFYGGQDCLALTSSRNYLDILSSQNKGLQLDIMADRTFRSFSHYLRTGIDYDLSDRWATGVYITSNWYQWKKDECTQSDFIGKVALPDSMLSTYNLYKRHHTNLTGGANISYKKDDLLKWDTSFDFQLFDHTGDLSQQSLFLVMDNILRKDTLTGGINGKIDIYTGQTNLNYTLSDKFKLLAGVKTSFVRVDNTTLYKNPQGGICQENSELSSAFAYRENINAVYGILDAQWNDSFSSEVGLRLENTNVNGKQSGGNRNDTTFVQRYTHLFPTCMIKYQPSELHNFSFVYGRRIVRPNYRDLNPFVEVNDRYLHELGNTELKPELTDNVELLYAFRKQYSVGLFYSHRLHPITKSYLVDEDDVTIVMPLNLSSNHSAGIRLGLNNLKPFQWWQLHINAAFVYKQYHWSVAESVEKNQRITPMVNMNNQLLFPHDWFIELNGFYNGMMVEGQALIHPVWMVSAGIKKNIFRNKATVYLYVNDIFSSNRAYIDLYSPMLEGWYKEKRDTRVVGVTFTYRFNSGSKVKVPRSGDRIDESKRINL